MAYTILRGLLRPSLSDSGPTISVPIVFNPPPTAKANAAVVAEKFKSVAKGIQ